MDIREKKDIIILAIESSCDETAAAVVKNGTGVLSNIIASQIEIHKRFGGVVPEIASRNHTLALPSVTESALSAAGLDYGDIDAVAVTYGAGLLGALLTGVSYAKGLSYALKKPLMAVSHVRGHIAANYIAHRDLTFPYVCALASGGHTAVLEVKDYGDIEVIGATKDDAAGEVFDKVARALGLPYPGGPKIQELAAEGKPVINFGKPYSGGNGYDFSFSGLKTAVINYIANSKGEFNAADVAASFQFAAVSRIKTTALKAAVDRGIKSVALAGGVGANLKLRAELTEACATAGIKAYFLPLELCTDNAAMIAAEAYFMIKKGKPFAATDLDAQANLAGYIG
ncbi:MAG: tRNA (adenosine(37)-N6)-threonylcarbamoyltransferase complex transferase subunit TsaD [Clostridiales bacterium]|jgi:N6-L-threonylcarbamoyladenine synthase|nr:tRNA (adenosine(37)-N6)-threonylcarbamoyltransferase complex transferase subunit TsaD [Clostridiales bacterium]